MQINKSLLIAVGFITGLAFWFVLLHRRRAGNLNNGQIIPFIFAVGFACRILLTIGTPNFYAPDEQSHFNYVRFLVEQRSFPVQTSKTDAANLPYFFELDLANDWEYYQPPLYYLAQVPIYLLSTAIFHDDYYVIRALRFISILLWVGTGWLALRFLRILEIDDEILRVVVISMVCLLPTYTVLSSMMNSDNMLIWIGSLLLCSIARRGFTTKAAIITGFLLGFALLTKLSAVVYCAAIVALVAFRAIREPLNRHSAINYLLIIGTLSALIWLPWVARNLYVYGSITAESVAMVPFPHKRTMTDAVTRTLLDMNRTFWSVSGIYNNIHSFFPYIGMLFSAFALFGLLNIVLSKGKRNAVFVSELDGSFLAASTLAIMFNAILVLRFGMLYGQGQGRYLFPLLLPISLLIGIGLRRYRIKNLCVHIASFFITYAVTFTLFSLGSFPRLR